MSTSGQNGHGVGHESLDDVAVEELLTGRYEGDAPNLVAVRQFLEHVRSFAELPVPPPSAALAQILHDPVSVGGGNRPRMSPGSLQEIDVGSFGSRAEGRAPAAGYASRPIFIPTLAAAVSALLAVIVVAAGSAHLLPGPTQDFVAKVVRTVTPFDFPREAGPEAVLSRGPSSQAAPPPAANTEAQGDSSRFRPGESGTDGSDSVGRDGTDRRPTTSGVNAPPIPTSTLVSRAAPTVPETTARSSPAVTGSSAPPPPPASRRGFNANLSGAIGAQAAGDSDGHGTAVLQADQGRDELCLTVVVSGVASVTFAHVHSGSIGLAAPVVATFAEPTAGTSATCVSVTRELIKKIRKNPENYYVDVHTNEFPNGALSGHLKKQ